jgi:ADP-ribose pyrophosphatase YjhB (NUDIX family)
LSSQITFLAKRITMDFLNNIKRLKALADIGLLYAKNDYDRERYDMVHDISLSLLAGITDKPLPIIQGFYSEIQDYPTPKVDIRSLVLNEKSEILMVQEQVDGCWALPGGWADIGATPAEVAAKEVLEEAGLKVEVKQLLAIFDKRCYPHPPEPYYVYKMVFGCQYTEGVLAKGFDILDARFFSIHQLPPLSEPRILASQIQLVFDKWVIGDLKTHFD